MLEPGTSVSAFSPGQTAASSHVKHARAGKEDAAPTATSVALVRLQVCTRYGKEDAVPVAIEQKDQRRSGHLVYWVRREERDNVVYWKTNGKIKNDLQRGEERRIGTKEREQAVTLLLQETGHLGPYFSALSTVSADTKAAEIQTSGGLANPL